MSVSHLNRNLLFGILALQMDLIRRPQLIEAMRAWLQDGKRSIEEILVEQGGLGESDRQLLAPLVARHIDNHHDDPEESLATLSSIGSVVEDLKSLGDAQLDATLTVISSPPSDWQDREALEAGSASDTVGEAVSIGLRYRILRPHAKGGLGEVSVAQDRELNREVALKLIQSQFAHDEGSCNRFVLEAEVTGGLEHPGIVPVYGLGRYDDGRPFYAMRFIRGDSLKQAADRFHRTQQEPAEREQGEGELLADPAQRESFGSVAFRKLLGRFVDVCNAIAYAHSRGVLHRDLKPGNIMLGKYGETLVVDWGLAKVRGRDEETTVAGETTLRPQSGSEMAATAMGSAIGTPAYMPPEQAAGHLDQLGPASDVYSLGATLYYLLTGRSPVEEGTLDEVLEKVRTGDFPQPRTIQGAIPKPLESICLRAMATRPQDRYQSAQALADDIERFQADEPVRAHPDPISVRVRRWMRKHPKSVAAMAATLLVGLTSTLVIASVVSGKNRQLANANAGLDRANAQLTVKNSQLETANQQEHEARKEAEARRQESEAVLAFFQNKVLAAARPEGQRGGLGIDATIRAAIDAAEPQIASSFADQPLVEASIRYTLGRTYLYLGEAELAIGQHELARRLYESQLGPDHSDTLTTMIELADASLYAGRISDALSLSEETLKLTEDKLGTEHPKTLSAMNELARAYRAAGRVDEAILLLEETLKLRKEKLGPDHSDTLTAMNNLASAYQTADRLNEALPLLEETLKLRKEKLGAEHVDTLTAMNNLAQVYQEMGRLDEALPLLEETLKLGREKLGTNHFLTLCATGGVARVYRDAGRLDEALPLFEETMKLWKETLGTDHPNTLTAMDDLARVYRAVGRVDEAITLFDETLKLKKKKLGTDHPDTLTTMNNLAVAYDAARRLDEAIALFKKTLELKKEKLGTDHLDTLTTMNNLVQVYRKADRLDEAVPLLEETLNLRQKKLGPDHSDTLTAMNNLAKAYLADKDPKKALSLFDAFIVGNRKQSEDTPYLAGLVAGVAIDLVENGLHSAAEPYLREYLEICEKTIAAKHWLRFNAQSMLGRTLAEQGRDLLATDKLAAEKKFTEAELQLVAGYEGMKPREAPDPEGGRVLLSRSLRRLFLPLSAEDKPGQYANADSEQLCRRVEVLQRLVSLYNAWGKPGKAAKWQAELDKCRKPAESEPAEDGNVTRDTQRKKGTGITV